MVSELDSDTRVYEAIRAALTDARTKVAIAVNTAMAGVYWEIGRKIAEAVGDRAEYGRKLIKYLSERLMAEFGKGFDESTLRKMRKFYLTFPIRDTLSPELTWSHYRLLIRVDSENRRAFYKQECIAAGWTVRQLERQINSFFYERLLATQQSGKESVYNEFLRLNPAKPPSII